MTALPNDIPLINRYLHPIVCVRPFAASDRTAVFEDNIAVPSVEKYQPRHRGRSLRRHGIEQGHDAARLIPSVTTDQRSDSRSVVCGPRQSQAAVAKRHEIAAM